MIIRYCGDIMMAHFLHVNNPLHMFNMNHSVCNFYKDFTCHEPAANDCVFGNYLSFIILQLGVVKYFRRLNCPLTVLRLRRLDAGSVSSLQKPASKMTYIVSSGALNSTHSLTSLQKHRKLRKPYLFAQYLFFRGLFREFP